MKSTSPIGTIGNVKSAIQSIFHAGGQKPGQSIRSNAMLDKRKVDLKESGVASMTLSTQDTDMEYGELHLLAAKFIKETSVLMVSLTGGYDPEYGESSITVIYKTFEGVDAAVFKDIRERVAAWMSKFEKEKRNVG